jgi:hypothetical protein
MAYWSEVVIALSKEGHEKFNALLTAKMLEEKFEDETPFDVLSYAEKTDYSNGAVLYHWYSIKWYDHMLKSIMAIMDALNELNTNMYRYVRIGEELGDWNDEGCMEGPPFIGISYNIDIYD